MSLYLKRARSPYFWPILSFALAANGFAAAFVFQEKFIYFWDYVTYWKKFTDIAQELVTQPWVPVLRLLVSVRVQDYNDLAAWPLVPFALLFGAGRLSFILSIVNAYLVPVGVSFLWLGLQTKEGQGRSAAHAALALGVVALSPAFWDPPLNGYIDVGGLFIANLCVVLFWKYPWDKPQEQKTLIRLALALAMLPIFRRWYSFWVQAFFMVTAVMAVTHGARHKASKQRWLYLKQWGWTVLWTAVLFNLIAFPLPLKILRSNYAYMYSAMRNSQNLADFVGRFVDHFGMIHIGLALAGLFMAARRKGPERSRVLFVAALGVVTFLLFSRVQDFGAHHYLILLQPLLLCEILLVLRARKAIFRALVFAALLVCFGTVLLPQWETLQTKTQPWTPKRKHYPKARQDLPEIQRLAKTLLEMGASEQNPVYLLASSKPFNSDILKFAERAVSLEKPLSPAILWTHNIDKAERFPNNFFKARLIVVADPVQYHVKPEDQRIVGLLAEQFLKGEGLSRHYRKLEGEFQLDKGVKAYLYEKKEEIPPAEVEEFRALLLQFYPEWATQPKAV